MRYLPLTDSDRSEIKKTLNIREVKELFSDIPKNKLYFSLEKIPAALPENKLISHFKQLAQKNKFHNYLSFLGAGAYHHFIPESVNYLSMKSEFLTPYTPYQPEVSQGSLQALFEYQTMLCMLTGLDIANCSLYDGGTAATEAALMALRHARKKNILVAKNMHPEYIEILETYLQNLDYSIEYIKYNKNDGKVDLEDLKVKINEESAGFLFQSPNFLGVIENSARISGLLHQHKKCYSIQTVAEAMSLPLLSSPGENQVDIVCGEAQSFGLSTGFGGPFLGFLAAGQEFLRQLPGRIVGKTIDTNEKEGFVLTISTREQHIRREKATSNICTNQAWCALKAAIYLSTMGREGLKKISRINHLNAAYFVSEVSNLPGVKVEYTTDFFNEVVLTVKTGGVDNFLQKMQKNNLLAGVPLKWFYPEFADSLLINFTEIHTKEHIDGLIKVIGETNE